jgi:hypothetical protein
MAMNADRLEADDLIPIVTASGPRMLPIRELDIRYVRTCGEAGSFAGGEHTITAAESAGRQATIATGLTRCATVSIQIVRSGRDATCDAARLITGDSFTVRSGDIYTLTAGDNIRWMAFGP